MVQHVEYDGLWRKLCVAVPLAGMDREEVALGELVRPVGVDMAYLSRRDNHQFRELMIVHCDKCITWRVTHFADDAGQLAAPEVVVIP